MGPGRRRRHRLREDRRRRTLRGPVPRGHPRGGAGVLHRALRRARLRGRAARAAGRSRRDVARGGDRVGRAPCASRWPTPTPSATSPRSSPGSTRWRRCSSSSARPARPSAPSAPPRPARRKEKIVAEAEKLAEGSDWRNGANRMRELLDEWKALPRIDRASDDALWRRFSTARTAYTRRRKAHFAEQHEKRDAARVRQGAAGRRGRGARRPRPTGARPPAATAT